MSQKRIVGKQGTTNWDNVDVTTIPGLRLMLAIIMRKMLRDEMGLEKGKAVAQVATTALKAMESGQVLSISVSGSLESILRDLRGKADR